MEALREEIYDHTSDPAQESFRNQQYQRSSMQRSAIVDRLRREGCRKTKQRKIILDIILQEEYSCCKEIYYKAAKQDSSIGIATVYRMINTLEDIGAISRNTMYRIDCGDDCLAKDNCEVKLNDGTSLELTQAQWNQVIASGLKACGFQS